MPCRPYTPVGRITYSGRLLGKRRAFFSKVCRKLLRLAKPELAIPTAIKRRKRGFGSPTAGATAAKGRLGQAGSTAIGDAGEGTVSRVAAVTGSRTPT